MKTRALRSACDLTSFPLKRESRVFEKGQSLPPGQAGFRVALRLAGMTTRSVDLRSSAIAQFLHREF